MKGEYKKPFLYSPDETCLDLATGMREVGDLISRAVVQKMIQAAITKRLPVFAGGDEGAVFAALFSFPCTV